MPHRNLTRRALALSALAVALLAVRADGASFSLYGDQGVTSAGLAGAGSANPQDGSTVYFNPAGMTFLPNRLTISTTSSYIVPDIKYNERGSTYVNPALTPFNPNLGTNTGGQGGAPGTKFFGQTVSGIYVAYQFSDKLAAGIGINAPFGLETSWDPGSIMRYHATNSRITDINLNLNLAYKILPNLSVAAGINISYVDVGLSSIIDYGAVNFSVANGVAGPTAVTINSATGPFGALPAAQRAGIAAVATNAINGAVATSTGGITPGPYATDGRVRFGGDAVGVGWNIAVLYEPFQGTKLGISFRSNIEHDIEGRSRYVNVPNYVAVPAAIQARLTTALTPLLGAATATAFATGVANNTTPTAQGLVARFTNRGITADLNLPMMANFGISQKLGQNWTFMGDVVWTRWSSFDKIEIRDNAGTLVAYSPQNYKDVFRYSAGLQYDIGKWTFRGGYAYDNTPVRNSSDRTPRLPDEDRQTLGVGLGYKWSERQRFDIAYDHLFVKSASVSNDDPTGLHRLVGKFDTHVDVFSFGSTLTFGPKGSVARPSKVVYDSKGGAN